MQRRQNQVAGLGELNAVLHGFPVADFPDQDHVGRLPQGVLQREMPALAIDTHLAMGDDAAFVRMYVLDRVFDRDDMPARLLVAIADHRGERGRLARARAADEDHETALRQHDVLEHRRQFEFFERRNLRVDRTQHRTGVALLHEGADAKTPDPRRRDREVALLGRVELLGLAVVHDRPHETGTLLGGQGSFGLRAQLAVDLDRGGKTRGDEQIGPLLLDHATQKVLHELDGLIALHIRCCPCFGLCIVLLRG